jgi:hypothetical protein
MMSIGGVTFTDYWNQALATDAMRLGLNAAAIASRFGVGTTHGLDNANPALSLAIFRHPAQNRTDGGPTRAVEGGRG